MALALDAMTRLAGPMLLYIIGFIGIQFGSGELFQAAADTASPHTGDTFDHPASHNQESPKLSYASLI